MRCPPTTSETVRLRICSRRGSRHAAARRAPPAGERMPRDVHGPRSHQLPLAATRGSRSSLFDFVGTTIATHGVPRGLPGAARTHPGRLGVNDGRGVPSVASGRPRPGGGGCPSTRAVVAVRSRVCRRIRGSAAARTSRACRVSSSRGPVRSRWCTPRPPRARLESERGFPGRRG